LSTFFIGESPRGVSAVFVFFSVILIFSLQWKGLREKVTNASDRARRVLFRSTIGLLPS
jgi:hypothetical protein